MYPFFDWALLLVLLLLLYEKIKINRHLDYIQQELDKILMRVWELEDRI